MAEAEAATDATKAKTAKQTLESSAVLDADGGFFAAYNSNRYPNH